MVDITSIIKCIDLHLEKTGEQYLIPPEANKLLESKGILKDVSERSGLPLRKLLRSNKIPYAYKVGYYWRIPHSNTI